MPLGCWHCGAGLLRACLHAAILGADCRAPPPAVEADEAPDARLRYYCQTCPYVFNINQQVCGKWLSSLLWRAKGAAPVPQALTGGLMAPKTTQITRDAMLKQKKRDEVHGSEEGWKGKPQTDASESRVALRQCPVPPPGLRAARQQGSNFHSARPCLSTTPAHACTRPLPTRLATSDPSHSPRPSLWPPTPPRPMSPLAARPAMRRPLPQVPAQGRLLSGDADALGRRARHPVLPMRQVRAQLEGGVASLLAKGVAGSVPPCRLAGGSCCKAGTCTQHHALEHGRRWLVRGGEGRGRTLACAHHAQHDHVRRWLHVIIIDRTATCW